MDVGKVFQMTKSIWLIVLLVTTSTGTAINAKTEGLFVPQKADQSKTTTSKDETMRQTELEARGKALRQAIDDKYKELEAPGGAFFGPQQILMKSVDVKDIVSQYLTVGMAFSDMEVILKVGGFNPLPLGQGLPKNTTIHFNNAGISGGLKLVADMHRFISFGIIAKSDRPDGKYATTIEASFFKQIH